MFWQTPYYLSSQMSPILDGQGRLDSMSPAVFAQKTFANIRKQIVGLCVRLETQMMYATPQNRETIGRTLAYFNKMQDSFSDKRLQERVQAYLTAYHAAMSAYITAIDTTLQLQSNPDRKTGGKQQQALPISNKTTHPDWFSQNLSIITSNMPDGHIFADQLSTRLTRVLPLTQTDKERLELAGFLGDGFGYDPKTGTIFLSEEDLRTSARAVGYWLGASAVPYTFLQTIDPFVGRRTAITFCDIRVNLYGDDEFYGNAYLLARPYNTQNYISNQPAKLWSRLFESYIVIQEYGKLYEDGRHSWEAFIKNAPYQRQHGYWGIEDWLFMDEPTNGETPRVYWNYLMMETDREVRLILALMSQKHQSNAYLANDFLTMNLSMMPCQANCETYYHLLIV